MQTSPRQITEPSFFCPAKLRRLRSLPREIMEQCRLCSAKLRRHSFRGQQISSNLNFFTFFLIIFVYHCYFRDPLSNFIRKKYFGSRYLLTIILHFFPPLLISVWRVNTLLLSSLTCSFNSWQSGCTTPCYRSPIYTAENGCNEVRGQYMLYCSESNYMQWSASGVYWCRHCIALYWERWIFSVWKEWGRVPSISVLYSPQVLPLLFGEAS